MAELTNLETKLAEVLGLAEASKGATEKVKGLLDEDQRDLAIRLDGMREQAVKSADRCIEVADGTTVRRRRSSRPLAKPSRRASR